MKSIKAVLEAPSIKTSVLKEAYKNAACGADWTDQFESLK